jgi:hypothetical protein
MVMPAVAGQLDKGAVEPHPDFQVVVPKEVPGCRDKITATTLCLLSLERLLHYPHSLSDSCKHLLRVSLDIAGRHSTLRAHALRSSEDCRFGRAA